MGKFKDYHLNEMQEYYEKNKLAEILGISCNELEELEWDFDPEENKSGNIIRFRIKFNENSNKDILTKIEGLTDDFIVYIDPWEFNGYYDYKEEFDAITDNNAFLFNYKKGIKDIEKLSRLTIYDKELIYILNRQLFIGIIGTMETFLSETFINLVFKNEVYFRNFIKNNPEFKKRKLHLNEILSVYENLRNIAKEIALDVIYHNLPKVGNMFRATFQIEFPDFKDLYKYISIRHDLVHRNGKNKEGEKIIINDNILKDLIKTVNQFVDEIAIALKIENGLPI